MAPEVSLPADGRKLTFLCLHSVKHKSFNQLIKFTIIYFFFTICCCCNDIFVTMTDEGLYHHMIAIYFYL